jgi:peptidoglycan-associated lipoprotein
MKRRSPLYVPIVLLLSVFVLWGCPKKAEVSSAPEPQKEAAPVEPMKEEPRVEQKPELMREEPRVEAPKERAAAAETGLQPIYFDFDRSFVRDDAKAVMKANAEWLKANPKVKIRIEGNCDERGANEYNQALGQRRASSAKKYLTDLGISAKRILLISYGKEKPVCRASTEDCWQKNRRDDLVATE